MRNVKCILVDDQIEALNILEQLLIKLGNIEVLAKISNANTAIDEILEKRPELVFIDMEMPIKTGIEVVEIIHEHLFFPTFIFVTAYKHYAIDAIKKRIFDYLLKPVNINELKYTIERYNSENINHRVINLNKCDLCTELTTREKEVLLKMMNGHCIDQIATELFISKSTVEFHRKNILSKSGCHSFVQLILKLNHIEYSLQN